METATDDIAYLRWHIVGLVRVWTALSIIRHKKDDELASVFTDVCSDHLRNMLHELANKKGFTLGFAPDGSDEHRRLFQRLVDANKWFEGKNGFHYRNCSGSHLQALPKAEHMFQQFGYGGIREWKHLTKGVAACLGMMKLIDDGKHAAFWREVRKKVVTRRIDTYQGLPIPNGVDALLLDLKAQ